MRFVKTKKTCIAVTGLLLAVLATGTQITLENEDIINQNLGIVPYIEVKKENSENKEFKRYYKSKYKSIAEMKEAGKKIIKETEGEGATLLKNENNVLPLKQGAKVSLLGNGTPRIIVSGTGSSHVGTGGQTKLDVLLNANGVNVEPDSFAFYSSKYGKGQAVVNKYGPYGERLTQVNLTREVPWEEAYSQIGGKIEGSDVVYTVQRVGGEGSDPLDMNHPDGGRGDYLNLNVNEENTLKGLAKLKKEGKIKSITVLVNSPYMVSSGYLKDPEFGVDAALWVGTVGETGQDAIADILTGKINPSGSLPDTFWVDNDLNPANTNQGSFIYKNCEEGYSQANADFVHDSYVVYQENIYVGYKYSETRYADVLTNRRNVGEFKYDDVVAFPFGHGESYTTFKYSDLSIKKKGQGNHTSYDVSVKVTNTGKVAGKEPVQIYVSKPYTDYDIENYVEKSAVDFVGFGKTKLLQPKQSEVVTVNVPEYYFASFDAYGKGTYILDAGDYYVTAATSAHNAVNNVLKAQGVNAATGNKDLVNVALSLKEMDSTTYSKALKTGNDVKSIFAFADINRYEGAGHNYVNYMTRDNWVGTTHLWKADHSTSEQLYKSELMDKDSSYSFDDIDELSKIDVDFPTYGSKKTNLQLINLLENEKGEKIPYDDPMWDDLMNQLTFDQIEAIVSNGYHKTQAVTEIGKPETSDHNGPIGYAQYNYNYGKNGYAKELKDPDSGKKGIPCPSNSILAATMNKDLITKIGEVVGEDCMWAGVSGLYGSGGNIHRHNYVGRSFEYFSEDGILAGLSLARHTRGIQSKGVYVYNKHFALNDQEQHRHGVATWSTEQAIRENYLRAFELPIMFDDAKCVMSAFNRLGCKWAGGCRELLTDWLRTEAGMSGFVVTDYMGNPNQQKSQFMDRVHMVAAGGDVSDGNSDKKEFQIYREGGKKANPEMCQRMRESAKRILYTVLHSRGMDGITADSIFIAVTPWWKTTMFAMSGAMLGLFILSLAWPTVTFVIDKVKAKK